MDVGASGVGWKSSEALARAFLILVNAVVVVSVHAGASAGLLVCFNRVLSGWMILQLGMNHL